MSKYILYGRRKGSRRAEDKARHLYVDRYSTGFFLFLMAILLLGIADAFMTLYHVRVNKAEELNPIMNFFLGLGPRTFFNVKYVVTAICLTILCLHKNLPIVRYLLAAVFLIYFVIVLNHLYLFFFLS